MRFERAVEEVAILAHHAMAVEAESGSRVRAVIHVAPGPAAQRL